MKRALYIGTYTGRGSEGIYHLSYDEATGAMELLGTYPGVNPSYLCLAKNGKTLYATQETGLKADSCSKVQAWRVNEDSTLTFLNELPTNGGSACHVTTDKDDKFLYCANYQDGTGAVFALNGDGSLKEMSAFIRHEGTGPNAQRQEGPHVHCMMFTPDDKYVAVCDLGIDTVRVYAFDGEKGLGEAVSDASSPAGSGARHIAFTPDGKYAYLGCEMGNNAVAFRYEGGKLEQLQVNYTVPEDFTGWSTIAAVRVSPNGKQLTVTNRGHDSLCTFDIGEDGLLSNRRVVPCGGKFPRDCAYAPDGKFLLSADQESSNVQLFSVKACGCLKDTGTGIAIPNPTAILFGKEL